MGYAGEACPERPSRLGINTPGWMDASGTVHHDEWLPGQRQAISEVVAAFQRGEHVVVLAAPTGSGKTIVGAAVRELLSCRALDMVHSIILERQKVAVIPEAAHVMGRNNFPCVRPGYEGLTADEAPCGSCPGASRYQCPYLEHLRQAIPKKHIVSNYAYGLRMLETSPAPFGRRDLLIADECHLLEQELVSSQTIEADLSALPGLLLHAPRPVARSFATKRYKEETRLVHDAACWQDWAKAHLGVVSSEAERAKIAGGSWKKQHRLRMLHDALHRLATATDLGDLVVQLEGSRLTCFPLWGWRNSKWQDFPYVLLMSATPGDPELLARRLGLPSVCYVEQRSPIPPDRRPVYVAPVARITHKATAGDLDRLADAIQTIAEQHPRRKGIVHTSSHHLAESLLARLRGSRFCGHGARKNERSVAIDHFRNCDEPLVLVTPSFSIGLDLPWIIGWQVIAKVPFADLSSEPVWRRYYYALDDDRRFGRKIYNDDAMNTLVQAAGRVARNPLDSGATYILDGMFTLLRRTCRMPAYFRESLR